MEIFLTIIFVILLFAFLGSGKKSRKKPSRRPRQEYYPPQKLPHVASQSPADLGKDAENSFDREAMFLDIASKATYKKKRILHDQEFELFLAIIAASRKDWALKKEIRVFPQVSLGEILTNVYDRQKSPKFNELAQSAINSKRCDILVTCYYGHPRVVVELQGRHHAEDSKVISRDKVKRLALESAGIALVEVLPSSPIQETLQRLYSALGSAYPAAVGESQINRANHKIS